jgi:hypothetical protein
MRFKGLAAAFAVAAMCAGAPASAQTEAEPDPATIAVPDLAFAMNPELAGEFDRYFYFVREDTGFATALADLRECDGYARGLVYLRSGFDPSVYQPMPTTLPAAVGTAIGTALAGAIDKAVFGPAQRRRMRRANMRTCMHFKGYHRYGLPRAVWEQINSEDPGEVDGEKLLLKQAKIASGPKPAQRALGR